jgi:hypothetical protein
VCCVCGQVRNARHPDSDSETVNRRSPVCGFWTNKGRMKLEHKNILSAAKLNLIHSYWGSDKPSYG